MVGIEIETGTGEDVTTVIDIATGTHIVLAETTPGPTLVEGRDLLHVGMSDAVSRSTDMPPPTGTSQSGMIQREKKASEYPAL